MTDAAWRVKDRLENFEPDDHGIAMFKLDDIRALLERLRLAESVCSAYGTALRSQSWHPDAFAMRESVKNHFVAWEAACLK